MKRPAGLKTLFFLVVTGLVIAAAIRTFSSSTVQANAPNCPPDCPIPVPVGQACNPHVTVGNLDCVLIYIDYEHDFCRYDCHVIVP